DGQRLQGHRGGHVAAAVSPHPVGHREQGLVHQVRVLVSLTRSPDVGSRGDPNLHRRSSRVVLPNLIRSPACSSEGLVTFRWFRYVPLVDPRSSTYQAPSRLKMRAWKEDR